MERPLTNERDVMVTISNISVIPIEKEKEIEIPLEFWFKKDSELSVPFIMFTEEAYIEMKKVYDNMNNNR